MESRKISELRQHPLNDRIYGDDPDPELVASIGEQGVMVPIVVTPENQVISGHRRVAAAKLVGLEDVPITLRSFENEEDAIEAIVHYNRQRAKTNEQRAREAQALTDVETARAARRIEEHGNTAPGRKANTSGNTSQGVAGRASDKVGAQVGWSGKTAQQAVQVVEHIDELREEGEEEKAQELTETFNKSVSKASKAVPKKKTPKKAPAKAKFNRTNDSIKWAKWTWNPVTGCKHGCEYCYAAEITQRRGQSFEPCFHQERLEAPANTKPDLSVEGGDAVFVCSMADLFGSWVPNDWIWPVLRQVEANPQWTFLFLTKNPQRYASVQFPDNAWIGATVDQQSRVESTQEALANAYALVRFVSCEPLLEPVEFTDLSCIDWIIIGAQSGTSRARGCQPDFAWIETLHNQARAANIPVYWKENLKSRPQEYPSLDLSGTAGDTQEA